MGIVDRVTAPAGRLGAMAQNALEVARFGGLETGEERSPSIEVCHERTHRLKRFFADEPTGDRGSPVVLVPPLMLAADVWDVSPATSAVRALHAAGLDPWVVDFGAPEDEEGGLERTLADHVLAVSRAIDDVIEATGHEQVHLAGYSQGGMFCYQAAAYRRARGLASVVAFGSPVDTRGVVPFGLPEELVARAAGTLLERTFGRQAVPAWMSRAGFRLLDPVKAVKQQVDFVLALHDRDALLPRERQRRFLQADGWVAWPGPALADFMRQFVVHNRMLSGGFVIEDRLVTLADITCPVLVFVGEVDEIAPPGAVRPIVRAAPRAEVFERALPAGHFGLVVGSTATRETWPVVVDWVRHIDEGGPLPDGVVPADDERTDNGSRPALPARASHGVALAAQVGVGAVRSIARAAEGTVGTVRAVGGEAVVALPRLTRLESVRPRTRISIGSLLDEQAEKAPDGVFFLFEDRAHTNAAAKHRIDSVVKGLLSLGVRQGEHVGVLMAMRPSALVAVAALNRLGAVAVMLRPDGSTPLEAELGGTSRIIADPEHMDQACEAGVPVLVLGGGAAERDLGSHVIDMERIDPDEVAVPAWFRANPGRARDLAFVLFTGEGDRTRINRITNRRWALSAFGTASAAALGDGDTVYVVTPVHHPSALLTGLGGAIAGGSRIAMAERFEPEIFWDEVRRYGVTVASYTWTMLRELVDAPPHPNERHHPVRLFAGSGMPIGLWRRVEERFAPARVLEFYASPQGEAILVNVSGAKPGAGGRPLPGSAEVRIAEWDLENARLETARSGFARRCRPGQIGMLLARLDGASAAAAEAPLRGVFARDDAWVSTGDLFRQDGDGHFWLVDPVSALVRTADGPASTWRVRTALEELEAVDLAVGYGVRPRAGAAEKVVAAVSLRPGHELTAEEVTAALDFVDDPARPAAVRIVDQIPVTTWYRPRIADLRARGLRAGEDRLLRWDARKRAYIER